VTSEGEIMGELHWKTAITRVEPNKLLLRGYRIDELIGCVPFSHMMYLAIKGELPPENVGRLMDAMLVSSVDHGATPPSALAAMTVASTGAPLNAALASGILAISEFHGGAIEKCMETLLAAGRRVEERGESVEAAAEGVVAEASARKERLSGFGHRYHTKDPRTARLFELAGEYGLAGRYVEMARAIEAALEKQAGRVLPINVDGAIAALLCELEFPPMLANSFFILARVPGLVAHIYEEKTRQRPMRRIHPTDHEYDGPEERSL